MYVDESGDPGSLIPGLPMSQQPSRHYALSALVIPASDWRNYLVAIVDIRRQIKLNYGFPMRAELHAAELIHPRGNKTIQAIGGRKRRISLYASYLSSVASRLNNAKVISVHLDKTRPKYHSSSSRDIETWAWEALMQRYQNYLVKSCNGAQGLIFADQTNEKKIRTLLRKMRHRSIVPSMFGGAPLSVPAVNIVEDPSMRNSKESYFIQTADLLVHALYRKRVIKGALRSLNVDRLYDLANPILLTQASRNDPQGIVDL